MSTNEQTPLSQPTSAVRNTLWKEQASQNLVRPIFDETLREYSEKLHQERAHQEKLKAVKARLNFEEASRYSESETPSRRRNLKERLGPRAHQEKLKVVKARLNFEEASRYSESETPSRRRNLEEMLGPRYARTRSGSPKPRRGRSKSPREKDPERRTVFKRLEKGTQKAVTKVLALKKQKLLPRNIATKESIREERKQCHKVKEVQEGIESQNQRSKSRVLRMTYPNHGEDPEDHLKIFQAATKTGRWAMPTWCHMFNSTLTENARVWFDDLLKESIDSYDDLRKAFLENYLQQKKCIKDPVEIHNIKQRDGESTEEFVRRYKLECMDVKGAPECMKIFGFMHGITNPELIKRLHDKIPKSMDEMISVTTTFLRGEGNFRNEQRTEGKQDKFTLLTKTPKEILALNKGKFKPPPSMTAPVEKRNASKFCEFHGEVGHSIEECMHLKRQIEEMLKAEKLSHLINELKQNHEKDQTKTTKKGETSGKDKPPAILMVQPWQRIARQRITQTFSPESVISFPTPREEDGTKGLMIIEAEMGGHYVHRMYVNGGSSSEILYEHCFSKFSPKIKKQLISANTPLVGFSGEIIWPLWQISLLVKIGDEEHSMSAWINFMVGRSPSPYNGIIGRPRVRKIRAIPSTMHGMLKFLVAGGIVTLRSGMIIPLECSMVSEPGYRGLSLTKSRKKKSSGNPSGISETNHRNRLYSNRGRTKRAVGIVKTSP
nr:reverse transcriptase domain-containing protein [Tanacetum cinerariifolium]